MRTIAACILMLTFSAAVVAEPQNPPPVNALGGYDAYELAPIAMDPPLAGDAVRRKPREDPGAHEQRDGPIIAQWKHRRRRKHAGTEAGARAAHREAQGRQRGARFWAGALAGDSYVVMKLKIVEQPSGTVVAEPEFDQRAAP